MSEQYPLPPPSASPYEDAISNRERRALRGPSKQHRLNEARTAQAESGSRIRIYRPVKNQLDFRDELKIWHVPQQAGIATRRSLGNLTLTVFDTKQEPLKFGAARSESEVEEYLQERYPALFKSIAPIEVTGVDTFGSKSRPILGLTFAPGQLYEEQAQVKGILAPELRLDSSHQLDHRPHVSLGQVFARDQANEIMELLLPVIPAYVQFEPARIDNGTKDQAT